MKQTMFAQSRPWHRQGRRPWRWPYAFSEEPSASGAFRCHRSPTERGKARGHGQLVGLIALTLAALAVSGCGFGSELEHPLQLKVEELERKNADVNGLLEQAQVEIIQLEEQIEALAVLPEGTRDNPYQLTRIKITRYTNLYDKDEDGKREKLIVYFEPIDPEGDIVKTAGAVHVQLWDLNRPSDQVLLGQWQVQPEELRRLWSATLVTTNYRLTFDTPGGAEMLAQPLTVKVAFTDYLTGQIFKDQRVVEP